MSTVTEPRPTVKPRKPRAKPQRFISLDASPGENGEPGQVTIHVGGDETNYLLERASNDWTPDAFKLSKLVDEGDGLVPVGEVYHVCFQGEYSESCECKGFVHHGHCKHLDSLKALRDAGRL